MNWQAIYAFLAAHQGTVTFTVVYVLIAAANALPVPGDPRPLKTKAYQFLYDLAHSLANRNRGTAPAAHSGLIQINK